MLEDPAHQRRYFIEYESGSATINDAKKSSSTRAKLDRYVAFFHGNYRTYFRDGWRPRLLFGDRWQDVLHRVDVLLGAPPWRAAAVHDRVPGF